MPKADTVPLIRFVRVAYVRPKYGLPPGGLRGPKVLTYRTFVPVVTEEDGGKEWGVEYEPLTSHWERVKAWMTHICEPLFLDVFKFLTIQLPITTILDYLYL